MRKLFYLLWFFTSTIYAQDTAQNLFSQYREALLQIQIIDMESGKKSSIGSGFVIEQQSLIVTNYHVVSDYVFFPDKYRIEYLDAQGNQGELALHNFDVVNDLAIVTFVDEHPTNTRFALADALPEQGNAIFSLGNPHDLGMIVVPGTFNGLKKHSFYQRIHFTGSINPGMSGGPAVDQNGQVIGVNVATAGNQIGFLIPLGSISGLLQHSDTAWLKQDYKSHIQTQLSNNQQQMLAQFADSDWGNIRLGKASIPDKAVDFLSCWGDSNANDSKATVLSVENRCRLDEQIYLNRNLRTGALEMEFEWVQATKLGSHRFYNRYAQSLLSARPAIPAGKDDVTNFRCQTKRLTNANQVTSQSVFCLRAYKEFDGLYDVLYIGATLDHDDAGLISHFTLAGVDKEHARQFTRKFTEAISWL